MKVYACGGSDEKRPLDRVFSNIPKMIAIPVLAAFLAGCAGPGVRMNVHARGDNALAVGAAVLGAVVVGNLIQEDQRKENERFVDRLPGDRYVSENGAVCQDVRQIVRNGKGRVLQDGTVTNCSPLPNPGYRGAPRVYNNRQDTYEQPYSTGPRLQSFGSDAPRCTPKPTTKKTPTCK